MYTGLTNHTNPEEDLMKANSLLSNPFYLKMKYCFSRKKYRLVSQQPSLSLFDHSR